MVIWASAEDILGFDVDELRDPGASLEQGVDGKAFQPTPPLSP
jgi:hypothetical protein